MLHEPLGGAHLGVVERPFSRRGDGQARRLGPLELLGDERRQIGRVQGVRGVRVAEPDGDEHVPRHIAVVDEHEPGRLAEGPLELEPLLTLFRARNRSGVQEGDHRRPLLLEGERPGNGDIVGGHARTASLKSS